MKVNYENYCLKTTLNSASKGEKKSYSMHVPSQSINDSQATSSPHYAPEGGLGLSPTTANVHYQVFVQRSWRPELKYLPGIQHLQIPFCGV